MRAAPNTNQAAPEPIRAAPEIEAKRLATSDSTPPDAEASPPAKPGKKRRLVLLLAVPIALVLIGGGVWKSGLLHRHARSSHGHAPVPAAAPAQPVYADMPDIIANLNSPDSQQTFIKLKVKLELADKADLATATHDMPRLMDMFTTYLRDIRPDELRGAAGTYRLREEILARANIALAPAHVLDVLFVQMIMQ